MGENSETTGDNCQSCGSPRTGSYCSRCGEVRYDRSDLSMRHVVEHGIEGFTHFDYKIPRTAWSLLSRPGQMEADILQGRRVIWAKPFALFVVVNLFYYLLASLLHLNSFNTPASVHMGSTPYQGFAKSLFEQQAAASGVTMERYIERFDALSQVIAKTLPFLFVVLMTLVFGLLVWRKRRFLIEHFYVALAWTTRMLLIVLIANILMLPIAFWALPLTGLSYDEVSSLIIVLLLLWTTYRVVRAVYGLKPVWASIVTPVATFAFLLILMLFYRPVLMLLTMALL